jgi:CBS domain-containing protein
VAEIMAKHRVHAVVITGENGTRSVRIVSDLDVVAAMAVSKEPMAVQAAATEPLSVSSDERLDRAAQLMAEHGVSHLVVLDAADGHPIGMLSTLDLAAAYAGGPAGVSPRNRPRPNPDHAIGREASAWS